MDVREDGARALAWVMQLLAVEMWRPSGTLTSGPVATKVSVRTLQEVFRTELGTTPVAYLRSVRLRRVHEELVRSDCSGTTIEAVAHRWGFTNYGRLARLYRTQCGMNPTATLRRGGRLSPAVRVARPGS